MAIPLVALMLFATVGLGGLVLLVLLLANQQTRKLGLVLLGLLAIFPCLGLVIYAGLGASRAVSVAQESVTVENSTPTYRQQTFLTADGQVIATNHFQEFAHAAPTQFATPATHHAAGQSPNWVRLAVVFSVCLGLLMLIRHSSEAMRIGLAITASAIGLVMLWMFLSAPRSASMTQAERTQATVDRLRADNQQRIEEAKARAYRKAEEVKARTRATTDKLIAQSRARSAKNRDVSHKSEADQAFDKLTEPKIDLEQGDSAPEQSADAEAASLESLGSDLAEEETAEEETLAVEAVEEETVENESTTSEAAAEIAVEEPAPTAEPAVASMASQPTGPAEPAAPTEIAPPSPPPAPDVGEARQPAAGASGGSQLNHANLEVVTIFSCLVLLVLAGVFGLLKIDEATGQRYSKRLLIGVPAAIIGFLLLLALLDDLDFI